MSRRSVATLSRVGDLVTADFLDHDPLPGQPAGASGAEYVVSTMHGAHHLGFIIDDLVAEADRVVVRWTMRATNTGPMLGRPPSGQPVELAAVVIFRIADGRLAERWGGWKPGFAPPAVLTTGAISSTPDSARCHYNDKR